jgi:copper(I)-binding protein
VSSSLRRGALAAAAIAFSIASLAACGAGNHAETLKIKPDLADVTVGDIKVQNVAVLTQEDPEATGPAAVMATVFNEGDTDQTLESITLGGNQSVQLKADRGSSVKVPAGGRVVIGGKNGAAVATVPGGREALRDGDFQKVTFAFSETGDVSLKALVLPAENQFADWGPSAVPGAAAPSGEPSSSASPSARASEDAGHADASEGAAEPSAEESASGAGH